MKNESTQGLAEKKASGINKATNFLHTGIAGRSAVAVVYTYLLSIETSLLEENPQ
jgi:hypothetical protein